jgi:tetratricopeptide (TPR) repeat protein
MSRRWILTLVFAVVVVGAQQAPQKKDGKPAPQQPQEQAPPEEDESLVPKEYSFNPLQASKELKIGNYYFKKGNYRAAALRFQEATRWDGTLAEAYLRLGEAKEKQHDKKAAAEAYAKYLEIAPDAKDAAEVKKRLGKSQK